MAAATFTSRGRGRGVPKEQFRDAPGKDTEDSQDFLKVLEDADRPKESEPSTSKSEGKTGDPPAKATEKQRLLLRKPHQIQTLLTHNLVQAKTPRSLSRGSHRRRKR